MNLKIDRALKTPVYIQIRSQLKEQILSGRLSDGYALPSERTLAKDLGVHRNTVVRAYNELKADGLLSSYQGVGYRVACRQETGRNGQRKKAVNWQGLIKKEYRELQSAFEDYVSKPQTESRVSFAAGMAAGEVYSAKEIADCLARIISAGDRPSYFYTPYQGDPALRQEIAGFMRTKGILANPGQIQIFSENNQALDFLVTILLSPGDKVFTEESNSPDVYRAIELAGGKVIAIPMDEEGMICENLGPLIETHKPRFIYVNSSYHNPTGIGMSMERKKRLLELSYQYRVPLIEEDEASELFFEGDRIPSLKSMDPGENVIYMYSFSLTMVPGVGISFLIAPREIIKSLSNLVSVRLVTLEWMPQHLACQFLKEGTYVRKLEDFRRIYKEKRDRMCRCLQEISGSVPLSFRKPRGGVYLWVRLPSAVDVSRLRKEAEKQGVSFLTGELFFPDQNPRGNYIRLNYSYASERQIEKGMGILKECMQKIQKESDLFDKPL